MQHQRIERPKGAFGAPLADQAEQQGRQREHLAQRLDVEVTAAVGQLAQHDPRQMRMAVELLDQRVDVAGQLGVASPGPSTTSRSSATRPCRLRLEDLVIETALVGEVVVDERLVDARAPGDAVHAGRVVAVAGELDDGGLENAAPGVAFACAVVPLINQPVS